MDYSTWTVDLRRKSATHSSGFKLEVEGNPRDPSAVHPGKFPPGTSNLEQVRLLRTGMEALARAVATPSVASARTSGASTRPRLSLKTKLSSNTKMSSNTKLSSNTKMSSNKSPKADLEDTNPAD